MKPHSPNHASRPALRSPLARWARIGLLALALTASALSLSSLAPAPATAAPLTPAFEATLRSPALRFILAETAEGKALSTYVLRKPVQSDADLHALISRLELDQNGDLLAKLQQRVRPIEEDAALKGAIPAELRAVLLRDSARRNLSFEVLRSGEIQFVELHSAKGSLRENVHNFLQPGQEGAFEPFAGSLLPVHRIPPSAYTDAGKLNLTRYFGTNDHLVLAISEKGDFSLVSGENAFVGNIMSNPGVTHQAGGIELSPGLLIRFPSVSKRAIQEITASITTQSQSITVTCVNGTCAKLQDAGIVLGGGAPGSELPLYRTDALDRMIRAGFQTPEGAAIPFEIHLSSDKVFERFFKSMRSKDLAFRRFFQKLGAEPRGAELLAEAQAMSATMPPRTRQTVLTLIHDGLPEVIAMPVAAH